MIVIYITLFVSGTAIASFFNATLYRIEKRYKYPEIIKQNSHCENCKKLLKWWELIPILGYILIKGKCSKCKTKVNMYYPLSELYLGVTFLSFYIFSIPWYLWIVISFLFILSYFDVKEKAIYRSLVHIFLVFTFFFFIFFSFDIANLLMPIIFTLMFLVLNMIKKSFGMGDILILLGLGIIINWQQYLVMFWLGIVIALLYSTILIIKDKIQIKGAKIPMIPFFTISFTVSVLYGEEIYFFLLKLTRIW